MGWIHKRRDLGQVIFVDLRDRFGRAQVVFDPNVAELPVEVTKALRNEFVIAVKGKVAARPEGQVNQDMSTGEIEVHVKEVKILNSSAPLPFQINEDTVDASETLRLKYRYLDIRREELRNNLLARGKITSLARRALEKQGFTDIETPYLYKSTPEGAREFIVPSRIHEGQFYALPQSPQLFKQVLMMAGMDRYYQIVKCFRDEDLRADRQPEFSQIDCEMSFVEREEVLETFETVMADILEGFQGKRPSAFPRHSYDEVMEKYGSDKPDLRFDLPLQDISKLVENCDFKVFSAAAAEGGIVNALVSKNTSEHFSRKLIDELTDFVKHHGAKGLAWAKVQDDPESPWQSPIAKFFSAAQMTEINRTINANVGDTIFFGSGDWQTTKTSLGFLRNKLAKDLNLITPGSFSFLWVVDFPLFEKDKDSNRLIACHHPFTSPKPEDLPLLESKPEKVKAAAYDLVINGYEIGGGSIRIHNPDIQSQMFKALGLTPEEAEAKFGFLLEALKFGAPPHGGIAFGLDRLVMVLLGLETIKDVIPFPKTNKATCLMTSSPNKVEESELKDLHIALRNKD